MKGDISWFLIGLLTAGLIAAAVGDWRNRIIPNELNGAIALLAIPFWWANGLLFWPDAAIQVGVALLIVLLFSVPLHFGWMGGGDVKLLGALALWLPWGATLYLVAIMSLAGGALTLAMAIVHHLSKSVGRPEIPYGIAIAFAGLWLIGERFLNQFV
ncbi:prepilin peptidase [Sphingosinicella sp. BN140058]|uniref:A24 family peptidase n=1 Tax=Sphingosinicella sp. BN140058 TaxID=1892855 RepID=UPI0010120E48|nr:prepilin peptidase [Sphingosinicella sp. BN140058]QAY79576.1 peptidase [Sphingosinicella sp. BN140058]